jgi:hypothetical protein
MTGERIAHEAWAALAPAARGIARSLEDRAIRAETALEQLRESNVDLAAHVVAAEREAAGLRQQLAVDMVRESRIARARGLAQAIAECRDDARLDGIREGAAEIVVLLKGRS